MIKFTSKTLFMSNQISKRSFIKTSALAAFAICIGDADLFAAPKHSLKRLGLILGVVEKEMKADWKNTLQQIAAIGYSYIEYSGLYGTSLPNLKKKLKQVGLRSVAGGSVMAKMRDNNELQKMIEEALLLEKKYLVCYWPWLDDGSNKKEDDFKKCAEALNIIGEQCHKAGIRFAMHNHDKEFVQVSEFKTGYDILLKQTDPALVAMELDLYWASFAGANPVALLNAHPGRFHLLHVKDMEKTAPKRYTCPGNGCIDFAPIFTAAKKSGVKYYIVEIDQHPRPMECITSSYQYLKSLRY